MQKKFETKYGYFTEDGREFVITNYRTPRPWVNVISNGNYGLVVSQLNGGFSWITHANLNRLTRWQQDLIRDNWGKYVYLRDEDTGEFWSPTVQPVMKDPDEYRCHHGIGYTSFHSVYGNIEANWRLFVPFDHDLEIWTLTIKNTGARPRRLGIFTYFEWCLGAAPDNHREFHKTFLETSFDEKHQVLLARKRLWEVPYDRGHWNAAWNRVAYFASSEHVDGFESDKEAFLGMYRDLSQPLALETGELSNTQGKWNDSICSLKKVVEVSPGQERQVHFFLGVAEEPQREFTTLEDLRQPNKVESAFDAVKQAWERILDATTIETPDEAMNIMTNVWLKYQVISGRLWGRAAYYQQSGAFGFRDQLQDSQVFLYSQPELTKKQILLHARHQFREGKVLHWWHPITEQGHDGNMSDDLLWLPFVTIQYLKETADWSALEELVPFYDHPEPKSLLHHCLRAIELVLSRFSERGLPLILAGDWNDGLSAVGLDGRGESVWLAHFLYYVLMEMLPILVRKNLLDKADYYRKRAEELKNATNEFGWDGNWFWRASKDCGELIGSHANNEGQIFLNPQTWAIISNSISHERKQKIIEAVETRLEGEFGPLLLYPAYKAPDPYVGYLSRYAPGVRENGGVYTHAATWAIWAECLLKRGEQAYRIYKKICPIYNGMNPDRYFAEPYVTAGNIDGPDSPHLGRGGWTWYTGSAAWLFRVTLDAILGIRADYQGLVFEPCLPKDWNTVKVRRLFRGTKYLIEMSRFGAKQGFDLEIFVDGQKIEGNLVPAISNKAQVEILVKIYEESA